MYEINNMTKKPLYKINDIIIMEYCGPVTQGIIQGAIFDIDEWEYEILFPISSMGVNKVECRVPEKDIIKL